MARSFEVGMRSRLPRRRILQGAAALFASGLVGCSTSTGASKPKARRARHHKTEGGTSTLAFGPMSTEVTEGSAILWARSGAATTMCFEVGLDEALRDARRTPPVKVGAETDFIHTAAVTGLEPGRKYFYRAFDVDRGAPATIGRFTTAPVGAADARIVFGADLLQTYMPFRLLDRMTAERPDLFLMLGDSTYADHGGEPAHDLATFREKHRDIRRSPELERLLAATGVWATWDDHECFNDADRTHPLLDPARQAFREYWPIAPAPGAGAGIYRAMRWGSLAEIFMLDTRSFRDPDWAEDGPNKTMLGAAQKAWLFERLRASTARHKIIVSSVPFLAPFGKDSWFAFAHERDEIKRFIREARVERVVILSADFHMAWHLEDRDTRIHEIIVGPVGAWPFSEIYRSKMDVVREMGRFAITDEPNYGVLRLNADPPGAEIVIHDAKGRARYQLPLG